MDFLLNDAQRAWQDKARRFSDEVIRPASLERDRIKDPAATFDWDVIRKGSALGFRTAAVPTSWGGAGLDFVTQVLVAAELARGDSAIGKTFTQCWKWSHLMATQCSEEQKERFLRPFMADHDYLLGRGITEPTAGSDNRLPPENDIKAGLKLQAARQGDTWILNGTKTYIANGTVAKLFIVDARTDPNVSVKEGTTMFLVPLDTPGFRIGKVFNKSGWRFYQNTELIFDNARVPHANVVGSVNRTDKKRSGDAPGLDPFSDLEYTANALGVAQAACDQALDYVRSHHQGGRPLADQQLVQLKLNRMFIMTEALRSFVLRVASEHDNKAASATGALVMNFSTDVIQEVSELNLSLRAGTPCELDEGAEKLVRDAFIWSHIAGDSAQRLRATQQLMREKAAAGR
jgi:alkylation response protein AidB-like acyl-CoA dehydrogenase